MFPSRCAAPFRQALGEVRATGLPFVVSYTVTGYPRALEASVVEPARAVADIRALAEEFGARAVVWRYDPILFTDLTPAAWHRDNFARLAGALAGAVDECVISFATLYKKTGRTASGSTARPTT